MLRTWGRRFDSFRGYQHGACRQAVKTSGCDSDMRGFESHHAPQQHHTYKMKHYCAMPFNHVSIGNNGDYQICCIHPVPVEHLQNIHTHSLIEWRDNSYLADVRQTFLQNHQHPGCKRCWYQEHQGLDSMRIVQQKEFQILGAKPSNSKLLHVEVAIGNLCNLSCLMCNEYNSSAILSENRKLGISLLKQSDFVWSEKALANLENILNQCPRVLHLRGGEPLYNKQILELITNFPQEKLRNTLLQVTTNATVWNTQWQTALSKFRAVRMMLSVDAVGSLGEYIRYPSKFAEVEQNILKIKQCANVNAVVHATVQNLNVLYLGDLIKWCTDMDLHVMLDTLVEPQHLQCTNLPTDLKLQAIASLQNILDKKPTESIGSAVLAIKTAMQQSLSQPFDSAKWQQFIDKIQIRDTARGNSHREFLLY